MVESRRTNLEKPPWRDVPSLRGNVEAIFLRPLYLGESIAPFCLLRPILAIIPWESCTQTLLDAQEAQRRGYALLGRWLGDAGRLWHDHGSRRRSLIEQMDYWGQLSAQLPPAPVRVVYAKAGTRPAAAVLRDREAVCEQKLYWTAAGGPGEAHYLTAVLNSETARSRVEHLQSRGQWGPRDFDKVMFDLPIPRFDPGNDLHRALAAAARRAEEVAAAVTLREGEHFVRARALIRKALAEDGVSGRIDKLVERLLGQAV